MSTRYYGCHVSSSGGLANAIHAGNALGINTIQIHPSPPQRWNSKAFAPGAEDEFLTEKKNSCVEKVFFHAIYLINLATENPAQLKSAQVSLEYYLDLSGRINGDGVIVHVGSMKERTDEDDCYRQISRAIDEIMVKVPGNARLLLEVAAGSGAVIGDRLEELARIYDGLKHPDQVGFALDTQHMWASGYDWQNELGSIIDQLEKIFGFDRIGAIHLNDSKTELASRKDRHENLGDGLIGMDALAKVFTHPKLSSIPFILETPCMKDPETAAVDVAKLRALVI